jgi:hypothetical protein
MSDDPATTTSEDQRIHTNIAVIRSS